ncbi:MAG: hypothetical protein NC301_07760 [Bacteroides sp.]|nr:hypothetical protein [Bacteroides sp.]MCM1380066.1 hypothetical protein [Bacteroides sp.]MCM1446403.1 hypothetical protein [Prevotella sp.]
MLTLATSLLIAAATPTQSLQTGDLIFEIASGGEMSRAIASATAQTDSVKFSHVGIIEVDSLGNVGVIEATGKYGVVITPLCDFLNKAEAGAVVKRLGADIQVAESIYRAKRYLGRAYDWWYLPDNEEIYCSELVEKSYIRPDGTPVFSTIPMNFRDKEGNMPQFWTDLFSRLGKPIPEGEQGTNPTQISRHPGLEFVCSYPGKP